MIKAIVCCARDYGIGKNNDLLFNIPADMINFKNKTTGKICVFGYNTYKSLRKQPLPDRVNIVLWKEAPSMDCLEGAITFNDFDQLVKFIKIFANTHDVYICGGAGLYKSMLDICDEVDITFVDAIDPEATVFFPNLETNNFRVVIGTPFLKIEGLHGTNGYAISQQVWVKK